MSIIQALHDSPWRGVFHVTGGGTSLLAELLAVPGASRTVLDASIPYANQALADLLGQAPEQASSTTTARALAMAAYQRARALGGKDLFGLGCTASLVTDRTRRGRTRAHWAIQTALATHAFYLELDAQSERAEQEQTLVAGMLDSLASALLEQPQKDLQTQSLRAASAWQPLLNDAPYRWCSGDHDGLLLLPGSFNPAHEGHHQMMAVAEQITGRRGAFELTLRNADKPDLDYLSVKERLAALTGRDVWLTNQATFSAKAELFPSTTFVLGTDTMERIGETRFYHHSAQERDAAIQRLQALHIEFLVLGRANNDGFVTLEDTELPDALRQMCHSVPESVYRNDLSSSQIRAERDINRLDSQE